MRATAALAGAGVMLAGLAAGCSSSSNGGASSGSTAGETSITIGYQPDLHGAAPVLIAQQQGFFKKVGLNVSLQQFTSGPPLFTALKSGSLDFGYEGPGVAATVIKGGGEILTVDSLNYGDEVIANPGINSVSDLRGKTVGVDLGTSAQMILDLALQQAGVPVSSVNEVNFTPAAGAAAYESHHLPALALWVPPIVPAVSAVSGTKVLVTDKQFTPAYEFPQFWLTMSSYAKAHPQTVTKFLEAWIMADNWRASHLSQDVNIVSAATQVPASALQPQTTTTGWLTGSQLESDYQSNAEYAWFQKLEQFFVTDKLLTSVVPPSQFIDTSYFAAAMKADHLSS
jgi:NitT/TauT family transport system substrate-binding protein